MTRSTSHAVDLGRAGNLPLLSAEAERLLAWRIQVRKDPDARRQLIEANLRLVFLFTREFADRGIPLDDLIVEGQAGLARAADRFDPRKGTRFSTYAKWWIRLAMRRAVQNESRLVRIPIGVQDTFYRYNRLCRAENIDLPGAAQRIGATREKLDRAIHATRLQFDPLPEEHHLQDDTTCVPDLLADARQRQDDEKTLHRMASFLHRLPSIERRVLELHFGLGGRAPRTDGQIGQQLGVHPTTVRCIRKRAIANLQNKLKVQPKTAIRRTGDATATDPSTENCADRSDDLGARLARRRKWLRLTPGEVGDMLGLDASYVSLLERGLRAPSQGVRERVERWLIENGVGRRR